MRLFSTIFTNLEDKANGIFFREPYGVVYWREWIEAWFYFVLSSDSIKVDTVKPFVWCPVHHNICCDGTCAPWHGGNTCAHCPNGATGGKV